MSLDRKAKRKEWTASELAEAKDRREKRLKKAGGVIGSIVGVPAKAVLSAVPGGNLVGSLLDKVVPEKLPVLKEITNEAALAIDADHADGLTIKQIVIRDLVPLWRDIQDGNYKGAAIGLATAIGGILAILRIVGVI